jgi:predicted ATP-grasp superfamily ATP-dependent carboligase
MYKRIYIDLYVENTYGSDVVHTIEFIDIEHPEENATIKDAIKNIYSHMPNNPDTQFSFIRVGGIPDDVDSEEEELFCVYKEDLIKDYGVNIIEYTSIWTGQNLCM